MSKLCMVKREARRKRLNEKYRNRRAKLCAIMADNNASLDDKMEAQKVLQSLPRDSSRCRARNPCWITGRAHGVYSFVGMSRNMFRIYAMQGDIPGLHKASW